MSILGRAQCVPATEPGTPTAQVTSQQLIDAANKPIDAFRDRYLVEPVTPFKEATYFWNMNKLIWVQFGKLALLPIICETTC